MRGKADYKRFEGMKRTQWILLSFSLVTLIMIPAWLLLVLPVMEKMPETNHMEDATTIAQKILNCFTEPLSIDGHHLHLSTSIGIAIYPEDAQDLEALIRKSDAALYYAKDHGRNQFKFFGDGDVRVSGEHKSVK